MIINKSLLYLDCGTAVLTLTTFHQAFPFLLCLHSVSVIRMNCVFFCGFCKFSNDSKLSLRFSVLLETEKLFAIVISLRVWEFKRLLVQMQFGASSNAKLKKVRIKDGSSIIQTQMKHSSPQHCAWSPLEMHVAKPFKPFKPCRLKQEQFICF